MSPVKAHLERRTAGKYPAQPYIAVVSRGEEVGVFHEQEKADIYMAGFNTGAQRQLEQEK